MKLQAIAYHIEKRLDLQSVRTHFSNYKLLKREHSFVLYEIKASSFLYIKEYGSIVFINCDNDFIEQSLGYFLKNKPKNELPVENYIIKIADSIEVDFNTIQITQINEDVAHIIMLNLAQSVAIMNYVNKTSSLHDQTLIYSKQLEKTGKFKLSKLQMRKFIGKTMNLKNNIAENLFVFDSPDLAWNSKDLSKLDYKLKDELDVVKRHHSIVNSLNVIKENLELFNDILQHKYSSMLEWIIIILILFEVVQVIVEKII